MFAAVSNRVNFVEQEEEILAFWKDGDIFAESLRQREDSERYVFYDGPPFATGLPHYGHLLAGTIKDIIPRYQTMRGHYVERRFGWDCHGLPIEALAQEALGLSGSAAIQEEGVDKFNEKCREMVLTYVAEWRRTVSRMGRWVDFDNDYKTMDKSFMETIWWVFKQLWDQGRIYKSYRIMPYSWKLTTPLSNFEAGSNYKEVQDPAITVRVRLTSVNDELDGLGECYALIWTTTPWTLPGNLALCVGPDIDYACVRDKLDGKLYVVTTGRLSAYYEEQDAYETVATFKGEEMEDWGYEPIFPHFARQDNAFRILVDDFVTTEEGTGIVHIAPAYGEDDFRICSQAGIGLVDPLDDNCAFTDDMPEYSGQFCKDADKAIIKRLKDEGRIVHHTTIVHSYPYCERTETPLIYRAIDAWYVRVEDLREQLSENNSDIRWVPDYVGDKRFGNWLKEAKDWNISRNRYWGSCIPVWVAEDGSDSICVGSIDELEQLSGVRVEDLHKHVVDEVLIEKDGKTYRRTPEVLDCWFESGSMPYAQHHYPFERDGDLDEFFPADFIAEGLDQTRGWFYTLLVLSTAIFGKTCYRNVIVNGLVLAEDGRKMSKRLKNYPDPNYMLDSYGADALRLYLINSPVVRAEDLCFSEEGVQHSLRHLLIPWWNAYTFFVTYARVDGWEPGGETESSENLLDRWIISSLERLTQEVVGGMDAYNLQKAVRPLVRFIEDLTNWYIRRSRRRFWKSSDDIDKRHAYSTLYGVLLRLCKISAPFVPFISEAIYRNLRSEKMPESVHLCDYPVSDGSGRDHALEQRMADVMTAVGMGRRLRSKYKLKVRQPLRSMHLVCADQERLDSIADVAELIEDELNIKQVTFSTRETELAHLSAKPNFRVLGPKLGPKVKLAGKSIAELGTEELERLQEGGELSLDIDGDTFQIDIGDLAVERVPKQGLAVLSEDGLVVALEVELDDALICEGLARELVNKVQNMRKQEDFEVTQRIALRCSGSEAVKAALEQHSDYIREETLCIQLDWVDLPESGMEEFDLNGENCAIVLDKR